MRQLILLFLLLTLTACPQKEDDGIFCTEEFVYGLIVTVTDANTNQPIEEGITVLAEDDDYSEVLEFAFDSYIGAGERAGMYTITVSGDGYKTAVVGPIEVTADECHVMTETVTIILMPN